MNNNSLGVVFSGGGSRTLAHVGLIRALEEHHIEATHVSGTSAGAIVAALYAAGYPAGEIFDFFKKTRLFKVSLHALSEPGFQSTDTYSGIFRQYFRHDNFDALQKKLFVAATDILNAKCKIFHEGKLIKVLLASAAYPMVFKPVEIENKLYFDGGITNDFPVEPIAWQCSNVIGSYVTPLTPMVRQDLDKPLRLLQRAYDVGTMTTSQGKFSQCDVVLQYKQLHNFPFFETKKLDELYEIGYRTATKQIDEILRILEANQYYSRSLDEQPL